MDSASVTEINDEVRAVLERIRALYAETLPLLAAVESLLGIPEEERHVGPEWLGELAA